MNGLGGFQLRFFACRNFFCRGNQHHIALLSHSQVLRIENDVHCLVPGNIFQTQCQVALDPIADDEVQPGEIGQYLQCIPNRDLLEIQRQFFTGISKLILFLLPLLFFRDRLNINRENITSLVRQLFVLAFRMNNDAGIFSLSNRIDGFYRGREIENV